MRYFLASDVRCSSSNRRVGQLAKIGRFCMKKVQRTHYKPVTKPTSGGPRFFAVFLLARNRKVVFGGPFGDLAARDMCPGSITLVFRLFSGHSSFGSAEFCFFLAKSVQEWRASATWSWDDGSWIFCYARTFYCVRGMPICMGVGCCSLELKKAR